mgnify:CR=1 FL=1
MKLSNYKGKRVLVILTKEAAQKNGLEELTLTGSLTYHHHINGEVRLFSHCTKKGIRIVRIPLTEISEVYDANRTKIYP